VKPFLYQEKNIMIYVFKLYVLLVTLTFSHSNLLHAQDSLHTDIVVRGNCSMCQDRIEGVASQSPFVFKVFWDESDEILHVDHFDQFDALDLKRKLASAGHDADETKANDAIYLQLPLCCQYRQAEDLAAANTSKTNETTSNQKVTTSSSDSIHTDIFVDGICGMCQDRIEAVAHKNKDIYYAFWDVDEKILHVDHNPDFNKNALQRALARAGHDTELIKATAAEYRELHACCKYRDQAVIDSHKPVEQAAEEIQDENILQGIILERDDKGKELPIIGANVYWVGTTTGTTTDVDGYFRLDKNDHSSLVVSYIGFENDTLSIADQNHVEIVLSDAALMREVVIKHKKRSTDVSFLAAGKMQQIGEKELLKAACCNLSESFETNPTIDASVTDAVTGTRQIQMLGLAGPNIQITRESVPDIRGLSAIYGLNFTPGTWIEGINISTGAGSVVNGFESIAGQIDVSLKKPDHSERFFVNLFGNEMGRMEANLHFSHRFNDKVSTGFLVHGSAIPTLHDNNRDGFLDHPQMDQFVGLNRWKFYGKNGLVGQFGVKITTMDSRSGQVSFDHAKDHGSDSKWGARIQINKYEGWAKIGKVFPANPYASIGLQLAASYFDQDAYFGQHNYIADQTSLYSNLIYQSIITDTRHKFKTGLSFQWDKINEDVVAQSFLRKESVPGAFFEYSYQPDERISLVIGLRGDVHNNYDAFITPRLHFRYAPNESTVFRVSGGRGQRTASIFAEHIGAFATSRQITIDASNLNTPYGLDAEVSWTVGFNFVKDITIATRSLLFQFDLYHTNFTNQIVADYDFSPQQLRFYNLTGESYSNSLQVQVDYELLPRWDVRLAYRFNDVQTTYGDQTLEKPLTGRERAFVNTQYTTKNNWSFDFTLNRQGQRRLPSTQSNPETFRRDDYSPSYFMSNTQISKSWNKKIDVYVGAINLLNYRQNDPIISVENPFSEYFDSSMIWAPIFGREIYVGLRYRLL
jgi:hypothetical protein